MQLNWCSQEILDHTLLGGESEYLVPSIEKEGKYKFKDALVWSSDSRYTNNTNARRMICIALGVLPILFPHLNTSYIDDKKAWDTMNRYLDQESPSK